MASTGPGSANSVAELTAALTFRAHALDDIVRSLMGPLGASRHSLRAILGVAKAFATDVSQAAHAEVTRAADDLDRVRILTAYLNHLNGVLDLIEKHLAHGTRRELSAGLSEDVSLALHDLGLTDYQVVLAHGEANNFTTSWGDVGAAIYQPLAAAGLSIPSLNAALFLVPRVEGSGVLWRPVLLGHEAAHVAVRTYDAVDKLQLQLRFDFAVAGRIANPRARAGADAATTAAGLYEIASAWAKELLCDAHAARVYGPAALASLCEYLMCVGPLDRPSATHPPGWLRMDLILDQLGPVRDPRLDAILDPWRSLRPTPPRYREQWAQFLAGMFSGLAQAISQVAETFPAQRYDFNGRMPWIFSIAADFAAGLPGQDIKRGPSGPEYAESADVVNAAWLARREGFDVPLDRLSEKTVESISFVRNWVLHGGQVPDQMHAKGSSKELFGGAAPQNDTPAGSLSGPALLQRLHAEPGRRLAVRPLLHPIEGGGIDLRLGHRFIVFGRSGVTSFDPLDTDSDPRAIQNYLDLGSGETFVLHPHEIVLGATLEYLAMPDDLTGQVITRSSYGRLGLLTATAVQVHGGFRGCLTLELANLSTIPIVLTPGERIAQLVLWSATASSSSTQNKYDCPIGPEFSRVREDSEAEILRAVRRTPSPQ